MNKFRTPTFWAYVLVGINLWFGILLARYSWNTDVILSWGGMSGSMPHTQTLAQLPPFTTMSAATLAKMPAFIHVKLHGMELILIRSLWASFLHFSWSHLGSNLLVLFLMGRIFEETNYPFVIVPVYVITGMVSMLSAYYMQPTVLTAGASGAIFGIMGAGYVMSLRSKRAYRQNNIGQNALNSYQVLGRYVYSLILFNIIATFLTPGISIVGHIAGLLSGGILGLIIPLRRN